MERRKKRTPPETINPLYVVGKNEPQNVPSEKAVLGAMIIEPECIVNILPLLSPESFYRIEHQHIYDAITQLYKERLPVDLITVKTQLTKMGLLEAIGGIPYILELTGNVASAANIEVHAMYIQECAIGRGLISLGNGLVKTGYEDTADYLELLSKAEEQLYGITKQLHRKDFVGIETLIYQNIKTINEKQQAGGGFTGISTGFRELDQLTGGWQNNELIIIAGRPAMGKTAFVLALARSSAIEQNKGVAIFSLEMNNESLSMRMLSSESEVDSNSIRSGRLSANDWLKINDKSTVLSRAPIYIDDTAGLTIQEFRTKARRLVAEKNVALIVVDYLQLMSSGDAFVNNREQEISFISRTLKQVAKELNVPVIALSQLSRQVESRKDNRPMLSDLRESGAIEQDADIVAFLYRPEYYNIMTDDLSGESTQGVGYLIIAKQRNGDTGQVKMMFQKQYTKFSDFSDYGQIMPKMEQVQKFLPSEKYSGENDNFAPPF